MVNKMMRKKEFIEQVELNIREGQKLRTVKLVRNNMSRKVEKLHKIGLKKCKNAVDIYFEFPLILWEFKFNGFEVFSGDFIMIVSNKYSTWDEAIDRDNIKNMKLDAKHVIDFFNDTLKKGESKRKFKGVALKVLDLNNNIKIIKL